MSLISLESRANTIKESEPLITSIQNEDIALLDVDHGLVVQNVDQRMVARLAICHLVFLQYSGSLAFLVFSRGASGVGVRRVNRNKSQNLFSGFIPQ